MTPVLICLPCKQCKYISEEDVREWCLEHAAHGIMSDTTDIWFKEMIVKIEEIGN